MKCYTVCIAAPFGTNTMEWRYTPFSALHQFFPMLPIIWAQVVPNIFCKILDGVPLNKKVTSAPVLKE